MARIGQTNGETSVEVMRDSGTIVITESWWDDYDGPRQEQTITISKDIDGKVLVEISGHGTYAHLVID
jgi:hypothetical protein